MPHRPHQIPILPILPVFLPPLLLSSPFFLLPCFFIPFHSIISLFSLLSLLLSWILLLLLPPFYFPFIQVFPSVSLLPLLLSPFSTFFFFLPLLLPVPSKSILLFHGSKPEC